MSFPRAIHVCLGLLYLGVLAAFGALIFQRLTEFSGLVPVGCQKTESFALRPSVSGAAAFTPHRNLPLATLPIDNRDVARSILSERAAYDVVPLGFQLCLRKVDVLKPAYEKDVMEVATPKKNLQSDAHAGQKIQLSSGVVSINRVAPWAGLIADGGGRRMAAFSFRHAGDDDWTQGLFVEAGEWTILPPEMAVHLDWCDTEEEAERGLPRNRPGIETARWGILDRDRVNWLTAFAPGTGATRLDGTEFTLEAVREKENPALGVEIKRGNAVHRAVVPANSPPVEGIRFEYPGALPLVVMAKAWRDGAAWIVSFSQDGISEPVRLEEGGVWDASKSVPFRFDQAMRQGLPVGTRGTPVWMAMATMPDGETLRLREGLAVRKGEVSFCYRRVPMPAEVRYMFTVSGARGAKSDLVLEPGVTQTVGSWEFRLSDKNLQSEKIALLEARRVLPFPVLQGGIIFAVIGAVGWILLSVIGRQRDQISEPFTPLK